MFRMSHMLCKLVVSFIESYYFSHFFFKVRFKKIFFLLAVENTFSNSFEMLQTYFKEGKNL